MERLKHLVVVVPGIGGSVLQTPEGARRWDERRRRLIGAVTRPGRLALDAHPILIPVDLMPDIKVIGPFVVPGYDGLVRKIRNNFADVRVDVSRPDRPVDPRADVVLFPYDFRLGIQPAAQRLAADIAARLSGVSAEGRRRRVIVVAHSLGGLVARYWLGPLGGAADCAALITLGTPHRGAPKALDVLVNGIRVGPKRLIRFPRFSKVLRGWPSVFELMPRYPAVIRADDGTRLYPYELDGPAIEALGVSFPAAAKRAYSLHEDIERAWQQLLEAPGYPEVIPMYARGHATPHRAEVSPTGTVSVTKDAPEWLPNSGWHGDGSVPALSATPIELDGKRSTWRGLPDRHLALGSTSAVLDVLTSYAGASMAAVRGEEPDRPWLGLDLDDTAAAGQPVPVSVTLHGTQADERTTVHVRARARARDGRAQGTPWLPCLPAGEGRWQAELGPLNAGAYTVEVSAAGVPHVGRLTGGDVLGVIDTETQEAYA